jgi:hypothetical protein
VGGVGRQDDNGSDKPSPTHPPKKATS